MKKLLVTSACLLLSFVAGGAMAAKPEKSQILHCGCTLDDEGMATMVYTEISVSKNARGHLNHIAGSIDSCFDGVDEDGNDTYADFVRIGSDCQLGGEQLGDLAECGDVVAGDVCGEAVIQE